MGPVDGPGSADKDPGTTATIQKPPPRSSSFLPPAEKGILMPANENIPAYATGPLPRKPVPSRKPLVKLEKPALDSTAASGDSSLHDRLIIDFDSISLEARDAPESSPSLVNRLELVDPRLTTATPLAVSADNSTAPSSEASSELPSAEPSLAGQPLSYSSPQFHTPQTVSGSFHQSQSAEISTVEDALPIDTPENGLELGANAVRRSSPGDETPPPEAQHPLSRSIDFSNEASTPRRIHHHSHSLGRLQGSSSAGSSSPNLTGGVKATGSGQLLPPEAPGLGLPRPHSFTALNPDLAGRGRNQSPRMSMHSSYHLQIDSGNAYPRSRSSIRPSADSRPISYIDLLNTPYALQVAPAPPKLDNTQLRSAVGSNAALLDTRKTLEMYRANVKKTNENAIQYEFAVFMVQAANEELAATPDGQTGTSSPEGNKSHREAYLREAKQILVRLADRSYPFAQYYLADGFASGLWNKGKEDYDKAFPLFLAASKHGHAESGYRTALCYEFAWGCRRDYAKAVQFYRQAASKNHPGAATRLGKAFLTGDMGLSGRHREGFTWLKRAQESADAQYNAAPYELGLLHVTGFGDDLFKDEAYAAQLFTQAADLGHAEASLRMGEAYEHGQLTCPKDPALSVHFYNCAAQAGLPEAMMALCAWYMIGAEPFLEKDENEAYEWAKKAAELGLPKAEYAIGYFTEMGIGCRRDPLEANVWYVRAADHGEQRATQRLAVIRAAASGDEYVASAPARQKGKGGKDENCVAM